MNQTIHQLKLENAQQTASIQHLTNENQKQEAELTSLRSANPAFFATLQTSAVIGNSQILKFDNVKTNVGGCYDSITGVFIASRPGTYHFTSVIYANGIDDVNTQMKKNNELLVKGYSSRASDGEPHTMNIVASLVHGDHIYVQHRSSSNDGVRGDLHSSFSGFMIS